MRPSTQTRRTTATTRRPALPHVVPADLPGWTWAQNRSGETALLAPGGESTPWYVQDAEARALAAARAYVAERPHLLACQEHAAAVAQLGWVARALLSAGWELHERGQAQLRVVTDDAGLRAAVPLLQAEPRPSVVELWEALRAAGAAADLAIDGVAEAARQTAWASTDLPTELHARIGAAGYRHVAAERDVQGTWQHLIIHAAMPTHARRWGTVEDLQQFLAALGVHQAIAAAEEPDAERPPRAQTPEATAAGEALPTPPQGTTPPLWQQSQTKPPEPAHLVSRAKRGEWRTVCGRRYAASCAFGAPGQERCPVCVAWEQKQRAKAAGVRYLPDVAAQLPGWSWETSGHQVRLVGPTMATSYHQRDRAAIEEALALEADPESVAGAAGRLRKRGWLARKSATSWQVQPIGPVGLSLYLYDDGLLLVEGWLAAEPELTVPMIRSRLAAERVRLRAEEQSPAEEQPVPALPQQAEAERLVLLQLRAAALGLKLETGDFGESQGVRWRYRLTGSDGSDRFTDLDRVERSLDHERDLRVARGDHEPATDVAPGVTSPAPADVPALWEPGPDATGIYRRPPGLPELQQVPPDQLAPGWCQPRQHMDQAALDELAKSLREQGQIDDVLAFVDADDECGGWCLRLIAGHRRRAAALQAGLTTLRVRVVEATALQIDLLAIASNDQREDLTDLERGRHYARMQQQHGLTTVELAQRLGETRTVVSQRLMLTRLAPEVQAALEAEQITFSQARGLNEGSEGDHDAQRTALATLLADLEAGERRGEADAKALARAVLERQAPERLTALGWQLLRWEGPEGQVLIVGAPTERPAVWTPDQVRAAARAGQVPVAGPSPEPSGDQDAAREVLARRGWAEVDTDGVLAPWVVLAAPELRTLHPDEVSGAVAEAQADLDALVERFAAVGWQFCWTGAETRWKAERADGLTVGGDGYVTACERLAMISSWPSPDALEQPEPDAQPAEARSIATAAEDTHADSTADAAEPSVEVEAAPARSLPALPAQLVRLGCTLVEPEPGQLVVLSPKGEEIDLQPAKHLALLLDAAAREMLGRVAAGYGLRVEEPAGDLRYRLCKRAYGWLTEPQSALEGLDWLEQAQGHLLQEAHGDRARWAHLKRLCVALGAPATEDEFDPRQANYGRLVHPALPDQALTMPELIAQLSVVVARRALDQLAQLPAARPGDLAALRDRAEAMFAELHGTPTQERRYLLLPPPWSAQETVRLRLEELVGQVAAWEREARELAGAPVEREARTTIVERVRLVGDQAQMRVPDEPDAAVVPPVEPRVQPLTQETAPATGAAPAWASSAGDAWAQLLAAPDAAAAAQAALCLALELSGPPVDLPTRGRSPLRQQILDLGGQVLRGDGADARPDGLWVVEAPRWVTEQRGQPLNDSPLSGRMVRIERDELAAWVATWPAPPQDWQLHYQVRQRAYAAGDALHGGEPTLALRHLLAAAGAVHAQLSEGRGEL